MAEHTPSHKSYCDPCRRGDHARCLTAKSGESNWPDPECTCKGECVEREKMKAAMHQHHQVEVSEPVSFIFGNGPLIVRPKGMSDEDWHKIVEREIEARS